MGEPDPTAALEGCDRRVTAPVGDVLLLAVAVPLCDAVFETQRVKLTLVDAWTVAEREEKRVKLPVLYADTRAVDVALEVDDRELRPELCARAERDELRVAVLVATAVPVLRALPMDDADTVVDRTPVLLRTAGRVALTEGVTASE